MSHGVWKAGQMNQQKTLTYVNLSILKTFAEKKINFVQMKNLEEWGMLVITISSE